MLGRLDLYDEHGALTKGNFERYDEVRAAVIISRYVVGRNNEITVRRE